MNREAAKKIQTHSYCEEGYMSSKEILNSPGKQQPPEGVKSIKDESSRLLVEGLGMTLFTNVQLKDGEVQN